MDISIAILIPIFLILIGAVAKKLVRGSFWIPSDFYLGVELSLSAFASALIFVFDIAKDPQLLPKSIPLGVFSVTCLCLLFVVMAIHQDWERRPQNLRGQVIWLGGFCNLIGIALMTGFVVFVKGIN